MINIGILGPSEIAFRRFLPALTLCDDLNYIGVAVANAQERFGDDEDAQDRQNAVDRGLEKAGGFQAAYGGKVFCSYEELIDSGEVDAVYVPLPPALHYPWAKKALECGKHVLVEKPATVNAKYTNDLIKLARSRDLALHENYMFAFHRQLEEIDAIVRSGELGEVRLYRIDFGFPRRAVNDFRYSRELGGGALLDCGGYVLKYAALLLGGDVSVDCARLNGVEGFSVDIYGNATLSNPKGQTAQVSFGMDNQYKCDLEVWGSKGRLCASRVLTAPVGFAPPYTVQIGNETFNRTFSADDAFLKSQQHFVRCVSDPNTRAASYESIRKQAQLVDMFLEKANVAG